MSENVIQSSFSIGELSPNLFARVDFQKYKSGCATLRNFFVDYRSGASTRTGTEFIRPALTQKVRLVRFQQSNNVTYILEFGHQYIRFITQGGSVVNPSTPIIGVTRENTATVTLGASIPFLPTSTVFIHGVAGMPQINNRYYSAVNFAGTGFQIFDAALEVPVNSTNWGVYSGGGFVEEVYTIQSPYTGDELRMLKFSQNASIMNITHPNHPPHKLQLISATNWVLTPVTVGSTAGTIPNMVSGSLFPGTAQYKFAVTVNDSAGQEGIAVLGGLSAVADLRIDQGTHEISWDPAPGAASYNIYGSGPFYTPLDITNQGGLGFLTTVPNNVFVYDESNTIAPDYSQTPPIHQNPFLGVNPQVSSYFQQRLCYANGGGDLVQTFWMSKTGAPYNFDISNPIQANDSITGELVSLEVNEIKSMVPMPSGLIMLTTKGAWQVSGGGGGVGNQGGPVTPTTMAATPQAYVGANDVPPIVINYDLIFVQAKGSIVRDLTYNIYANIYTGNDISILSNHLFYDHQILEWAYAEEPYKIIWAIREDGILLSLTLVKEQDMYGWARHDTRGRFISVATVTEGIFDATYFAVERPHPLNPAETMVMIERLADRTFPFGVEDAWCVDCGTKTSPFLPQTVLRIIKFGPEEDGYTFISETPTFFQAMEGWVLRASGGIFNVTQFQSSIQMHGRFTQAPTELLPDDPLNRVLKANPGEWSIDPPITQVFGLDQFEGQEISVLADGGVVNGLVVSGGGITLPRPATKVVAGYGFQAQLQTMPLDLGNENNTVQGKRKKVAALTVRVHQTRGLKAGRTFETVTPIKELNRVTTMGYPIKFVTGDERIIMDPLWDVPGQICLQQDDPLPASVLGVIPEVIIGDGQK